MAQLHQQLFKTSQTQMKALKNIASAPSFTSTVGCIPIYERKDKDACTKWLQRCKEASYYLGTTSDQPCCRDLHRMWQKSSDPWKKNFHMTNSLKKSCVHSLASPALQQPLMNCPVYASNLAKTNTETSTGGAPRSCHVKKHTGSHSANSGLHSRTQ